ncbi:hypothetical protein ULMS_13000 [Patiriisocius marinistellae]|uniref:Uncharacterized protein n=1 Tax=Patiriisocius marinistellae TaxID=2494560 RepID=A0A5J4FXB4_9FLAO|nr:hypothetical protein [Patiriisocius marinistellae]GEQ85792.1 hypothetical protein ULMS_13000 [Patiriisocius marinistellae]
MKPTSLLAILIFSFFFSSCGNNRKPKNNSEDIQSQIIKIENPSTPNSQTPRLFSNGNELYFSWVTTENETDFLNFSILKDTTWSNAETIIEGKDWFTNWADFPAIAESNGNILTSFLQKSTNGKYTYDVKLNLYNATTKEWKKNILLNTDGTQSEHGFVSIVPNYGGQFFISWLDGRNTVVKEEMNHENGHHGGKGAMTLRGAYIAENGEIINEKELDNRVCDCCQTSATMTNQGPVVVYRDRSDKEVRDISIVNKENTQEWSKPKTVFDDNWEIEGCPVNGPSIASFENSTAVAWFTGANQKQKVQIAFKKNDKIDFGIPIRLNVKETLGRVEVLMLNENEAIVTWMEFDEEDALVQVMKVNENGAKGEPLTISRTSSQRSSGFPQIELLDDTIYAAITIVSDKKGSSIELYKIPIEKL